MPRKQNRRKIGVIDFETDPFLYGRVPEPFCCEFYSDEYTEQFWGPDCADQLCTFLEALPEKYLIYAHNGGKFDFHFLHRYIDNPARIIKSRIVSCRLWQHELRDSYAILPVPLRDYDKLEFDYDKMERSERETHRAEILEYLHYDCVKLYELVTAFNERFGPQLTIGGTAIRELAKLHPFVKSGSAHDFLFRPFYFGGRVQCFQSGEIIGPVEMYDVNSMYPYVMRDKRHPINGRFTVVERLPDVFEQPFFAHITARSKGGLPYRCEGGALDFGDRTGEFYACSHEIEAALELDLIDIQAVHAVYMSADHCSFAEFIEEQYAARQVAKANGDRIGDLFAKLLMNSAYGRFGINPENFEDWQIVRSPDAHLEMLANGYFPASDFSVLELWSRKSEVRENQYADVSTAASITSAARAHLMRALAVAHDPLYCDTDSILCRGFSGDVDAKRLGAWKCETVADRAVIAGKKLYALYNEGETKPLKLSSKGGTLGLCDLQQIAAGGAVTYENAAPTFSLRSEPKFISRKFVMTARRGDLGR